MALAVADEQRAFNQALSRLTGIPKTPFKPPKNPGDINITDLAPWIKPQQGQVTDRTPGPPIPTGPFITMRPPTPQSIGEIWPKPEEPQEGFDDFVVELDRLRASGKPPAAFAYPKTWKVPKGSWEPRIFIHRDEATPKEGGGMKIVSMQRDVPTTENYPGGVKNVHWPSTWVSGEKVEKGDLPRYLYHVTTAKDAILKDGYIRDLAGEDVEGGLDRGRAEKSDLHPPTYRGVYLTRNKVSALHIKREIERNIDAALITAFDFRKSPFFGDLTDDEQWQRQLKARDFFEGWAKDDEERFELEAGTLDGPVDEAVAAASQAGMSNPVEGLSIFNGAQRYRRSREFATAPGSGNIAQGDFGSLAPVRYLGIEDPLIYGSWKEWATADPEQVALLVVNRDGIPDEALIRNDDSKGNKETMVNADVAISKSQPGFSDRRRDPILMDTEESAAADERRAFERARSGILGQ
jgi:hypothetical protein